MSGTVKIRLVLALELLAASLDGCSEAIMVAHGFSISDIAMGECGT